MTGSMVAGLRALAGQRPGEGRGQADRPGPGVAGAPLLAVSGLSLSFGQIRALDNVTLSVRTGELVALAGENGAGKTTLVRCIAGDVVPATGEVFLAGRRIPADPAVAAKRGIAVVWQDLALCDNLDIAANVMLGRESPRLMLSDTRFHVTAASLLASLQIPLTDTTQNVGSLSGGQRQLVAVARAMGRKPKLLALDEPTSSLGVKESSQVEELIMNLRGQGTTILLACHDIDQMFRLADRIVVLRQGRIVADLRTADAHPDDVVALISGQQVDTSARHQITRLHGLTDRLASADPSSSLSLILSALGSALGSERLCIHLVADRTLYCAASLGFRPGQLDPWAKLPFGPSGGPVGLAAEDERPIITDTGRSGATWRSFRELAKTAKVASSWSVPVLGPTGLSGVITVFRSEHGAPQRDELALVTVYTGYAANAIERDRLLDQVTTRNRVLETIREMLETLAGPVPVGEGLAIAVQSLRRGLQADEVALITQPPGQRSSWRAFAGPLGTDQSCASASICGMAETALSSTHPDGVARQLHSSRRQRMRAVAFLAAGGPTVLLASWRRVPPTKEETTLLEDAAHSLRLALEREEAGHAHQEAAALRRSRELQRGFLSRLSHELRTPLTAIRGYASSLLQPDVTWDRESQQRFLDRIAAESARLGRLVDDLLDFSAIESGIMRLQPDWCDIRLVVEAAIACLPPASTASVSLTCDPGLPVVWADHDRLEQVFVNLLNNAFGHNPPGTQVRVTATAERVTAGPSREPEQLDGGPPASEVVISVLDDGAGLPPELMTAPFEATRRPRPAQAPGNGSGHLSGNGSGHLFGNGSSSSGGREGSRRSAGAGLGLSIAKGIVQAHGGRIELIPLRKGTCFRVRLPVEAEIGDSSKTAGSFRGITGSNSAGAVAPPGRTLGRGNQVVGGDASDTADD
ncbi:MAG TPA: ATP-binding cassette domain-containing protein [Streptosporangiaceae bacterium]|nr:ATP-binding cassette domain-containing protein [Streptosporangiaceae bacterium]